MAVPRATTLQSWGHIPKRGRAPSPWRITMHHVTLIVCVRESVVIVVGMVLCVDRAFLSVVLAC